ncbi:MAG TPA: hypothetical protein VGN49_02935, partial [Micrococcaceae bacterium]|nr:hypothetical protein [Micrococcaceae bacterium]
CLWELGTYFIDRASPASEARYPPLSDLLDPLFASADSRWLMVSLWLTAWVALLRVRREP